MDKQGFSSFLEARGLSEAQIRESVGAVRALETFLATRTSAKRLETITAQDVDSFSQHLIEQGRNARETYRALMNYGHFSGNHPLTVRAIEFLDGAEVLGRLYEKLAAAIGKAECDRVFEGLSLPPLGAPLSQRPPITHAILQRLEERVDRAVWTGLLSGGLRDLEDAWYAESRRQFLEAGGFDAFLERKGQAFVAELERIRDEGGLYFTQEITDAVIDFVRSEPEIRQGVRVGDILYETKIPYMTAAYLATSDPRMKRYFACHCPWVRESLRSGGVTVSPEFCRCSAGFHKKPWEVVLGRPLVADVLESVLKGDLRCRFAIHLPPEALSDS